MKKKFYGALVSGKAHSKTILFSLPMFLEVKNGKVNDYFLNPPKTLF